MAKQPVNLRDQTPLSLKGDQWKIRSQMCSPSRSRQTIRSKTGRYTIRCHPTSTSRACDGVRHK